MISYMRDNFDFFGDYTSIDVMHSSIYNAKCVCYIAPVIKNEVGKINIVCKGFVISETHDTYTFVLDSLFKMCPHRGGGGIFMLFSDEFITQSILDSIDMKDTHIFYDHSHLKFNL